MTLLTIISIVTLFVIAAVILLLTHPAASSSHCRKDKQFLEYIINFSPDAILVIDAQGRIIVWNRALEVMTHVKAQDILGKGNYEYSLYLFKERRPALIDLARSPGMYIEAEKQYSFISKAKDILVAEFFVPGLRENGIFVRAQASPLYDTSGSVIGAVEIMRDISERKKAEEELKSAHDQLQQTQSQLIQSTKMASVGILAGGVAHEINNPLTGILNNVQLIRMIAGDSTTKFSFDDFKDLLGVVESSALRCKKITQSLLDFSHSSKGIYKPASLTEIVEKVAALIEHELVLQNIIIRKDLGIGLPSVLGDSQLLQQVIFDIINNASWAIKKKSGDQGGTITILVRHQPQEGNVAVLISDTGIGMPKETIERIFEPFYTTKPVGEGTGLGLSIAYNIIKAHKGTIAVESELNKGTTFKISLPVIA